MIIDITVPDLGESINEVEIGEWLVKIGDTIRLDDPMVAIESEKATVEIPAPRGGVLVEIVKQQGDAAGIGEIIGRIDTEKAAIRGDDDAGEQAAEPEAETEAETVDAEVKVMPSAARVLAQQHIPVEQATPTGPGGRILKEDAMLAAAKAASTRADERRLPSRPATRPEEPGKERRVPMSLLRRTIAARLLAATQSMAMLTTFNEVDMSEVKKLRTDLGPAFAEIEQRIADFGQKAKKNTLTPEELRGGTFTISNGGVYGSMLSTPIVNPPQSAILGLHAIKDRPVAVNGQVQIRPVMYLALSYDHRIIDGREAVSFLKGIKERIEEPQKLLLEI